MRYELGRTRHHNWDAAMDETTSTGSTDSEDESSWSRGSHIDTRQVAPRIIDLKQVDVEASWQSHQLSGYLCLYWDGASKASLILQVGINIAAKHSVPKKSNLYLVISPERIRRVSVLPDNNLPGSETQSLDFVLSRPPFLVEPSQSWEPRDDMGKKMRVLLYGLASQTHFSLCIPGHVMSSNDAHGAAPYINTDMPVTSLASHSIAASALKIALRIESAAPYINTGQAQVYHKTLLCSLISSP